MAFSYPDGLLVTFVTGAVFVLILIAGFFMVLIRSHQKILREQAKLSQTREDNQRQLLEAVIKGQEEERKRVAREVHDELGQMATVQRINLGLLKRKILNGSQLSEIPNVIQDLDAMIQDSTNCIETVKRIIQDLRPVALEELGLIPEIRNLIERVYLRTGFVIELETEEAELELKEERALEVYRIIQEAVTNVLRHANATAISIRIRCRKNQILVTILDNGSGIDTRLIDNPTSFGLRGMYERALMLGGNLAVNSAEHGGTQVNLTAPIG